MPQPEANENAQDLLGDSLALARTQLASQIADENSLDGRTVGTLGFNGTRRRIGLCFFDRKNRFADRSKKRRSALLG